MFSLILATVERTSEVERFLRFLDAQAHREFELIVVDQNPDDRLEPVLAPYDGRFPISHLRSGRGLSRARNLGLRHVRGTLVGFPDDDCWYPASLLGAVADHMQRNPQWGGVTGRSTDEAGHESGARFLPRDDTLTLATAWHAISYTIFLRREVVERVGEFDESLGVGAGTAFGSGEETDYVIRAIHAGYAVRFAADLVVHHPNPLREFDAVARSRGYKYGCGMGRVLAKHRYPPGYVLRSLARPVGGAALSALQGRWAKAGYYLNVFLGRLRGLAG